MVLAGDVAYRFPRDEVSRHALPACVALLEVLGAAGTGLPAGVIPGPLARPDLSQPTGRCHVALRRLPGRHLSPDEAGRQASSQNWPGSWPSNSTASGMRPLPTIADARIIETTFALQQALPAALSGDAEALADGLTRYTAR